MKKILLTMLFVHSCLVIFAQSRLITGTVKDAQTMEALIGVTITSTDGQSSTTTDGHGNYKIQLASNLSELKFTFLGYHSTSISLNPNAKHIDILLHSSSEQIDDVVITGYTRQNKSQLTGAVTKIDGSKISAMPVASLDQALQGQVAGLYVASPSGLPGTPGRVTIRGIASLQGGETNPLYIVDGVPIDAASISQLNPEDFESYTVLKDAASTAQYGSRAANGVIVVTTKKGAASSKMLFNYQNQFGFSKVNLSRWNMMNTDQRLQFEEMLEDPTLPGWQYSRKNDRNADGSLKTEEDYTYGDNYLQGLRYQSSNLNDKILRNAFTQSHNLSASGGSEKTNYFMSAGYLKQDGVLHNSGIDRYNLRSNIQHANGRFKLGLNMGLGYTRAKVTEGDFDVSETNPVAALYFALPYERLYHDDGSLATGTNKFGANALSMYEDIKRNENKIKALLSTNLSYQITSDLSFTSTLGLDFQQANNTCYIRPDSYLGSLVDPGGMGSYENAYINRLGLIATGGFMYNKKLGLHDFEANVLAEINQRHFNSSGYTAYGLIPGLENTPGGITPGTADNDFIPLINGGRSQNRLISQIGIFRYSYANRYTFTASLRQDGTSQVSKDNRYQLFYAFGGAWNIYNEDFMKNVDGISNLRLRGSYGRTGNAAGFASDFGYRSLYGRGNYGGSAALVPMYPGNPAYNWELNDVADVGLEFSLFNGRLRTEIDAYNRVTANLFMEKRLSYTSGFESMAINGGKVRNRGVELFIAGDIIKNRDFTFNASLNLGYNQNRILNLGGEDDLVTEDYSINKVGKPIGQFFMVRWAGVDPQTGAPMYLDAEGEKTYTFNPDDAVEVKGSFDPPLKGGLTLNFSYRKFELSTLFTFIKGMYRLNTAELFRTSADENYRFYNQSVAMLNMWQKPGDITDHPSAAYPRYMTDRELQNADYIKLRNLRLAYTIKDATSSGKIKNFKVFVQGQNIHTWTKFKAFDPEDDNNWYQYEYPLPRIFTAGFNLSF